MLFVNQNNTKNAKISHYTTNINQYLYQSTGITYEINSCVTRTKISQTLADSASGTINTTADQTMDTRVHTIDAVYCAAANGCSGDLHIRKTNSKWIITEDVLHESNFLVTKCLTSIAFSNYCNVFALYGDVILYFYPITQIRIGDATTTFSLYLVTAVIIPNLVLKGKTIINELHFIALISEVIDIILVTQPPSIFTSGDEGNNNGKEFGYCTAVFGTILAGFSLISMKTIDNMNTNYLVLRF